MFPWEFSQVSILGFFLGYFGFLVIRRGKYQAVVICEHVFCPNENF